MFWFHLSDACGANLKLIYSNCDKFIIMLKTFRLLEFLNCHAFLLCLQTQSKKWAIRPDITVETTQPFYFKWCWWLQEQRQHIKIEKNTNLVDGGMDNWGGFWFQSCFTQKLFYTEIKTRSQSKLGPTIFFCCWWSF